MSSNIRRLLEGRVSRAFAAAGIADDSPTLVGSSVRPDLADYQANGVMAAAKKSRTNPRELAAKVLSFLDIADLGCDVSVAGPGFINFRLGDDWMASRIEQLMDASAPLTARVDSPQTIVVDYSAPNLAKEMHVGHLRSTIIGDAVVRILASVGHKVIRQNHVGDWGTQFGMLIAFMERQTTSLSTELADLEGFYRAAKKEFDGDPVFAARARECVVLLQAGDENMLEQWRIFVGESLRHCQAVYDRLDVTLTDGDVRGESAYNEDLPRVIDDLRAKKMLTESEGAQCVFLDEFKGKEGEPLPVIVRKSDGAFLYATTDLAAMRYRTGTLGATRILYFVDARQTLHLRQVFAVAHKAGFVPPQTSLEHHAFGTMMDASGRPFKTRDGGTVKLMELLDEACKRSLDLVIQKNPDLTSEQRRDVSETVGIGAVKYSDLSKNRTSDYVFNWDTMLAFDGNTAPYLQYAYARIRSIFRKGDIDETALDGPVELGEPQERALALKLLQFAETVDAVAAECFPSVLCTYLYELAGAYMAFYEHCSVLKAEKESQRKSRLQLCRITARVLKEGLALLGIGVVEQM